MGQSGGSTWAGLCRVRYERSFCRTGSVWARQLMTPGGHSSLSNVVSRSARCPCPGSKVVMKRRDFIALIGTAAAISPLAARAQQLERPRLIGILIPFDADDPQVKARLLAFRRGLQELGWIENRNIHFDYRFTGQDAEGIRTATRRADCARTGCNRRRLEQRDCCDSAESDPNHPDRFRWRIRSCRKWLCYQPQPPDRKHHRISEFRGGNRRKMAGPAEGDCARSATSCIRVQP